MLISRSSTIGARQRGFTLIEVMIVVVLIGILSAVAIPQYSSYLMRQKIKAAQTDLATAVMAMESRYNLDMAYPGATGTSATAATTTDMTSAITSWAPSQTKDFYYTIQASSGTTYTLAATGYTNKLSTCTISINQQNVRSITTGCDGATSWY